MTVKDQVYTGKALTPPVTVKYNGKTLNEGTDYLVAYYNNKAVGRASVSIKGEGEYSGVKSATFRILPRKTSINKLTAGQQSIALKWTTRAEATGYEIQYSLKKNFSTKTTKRIKGKKVGKITLKGLEKGKRYYVRMRCYKKIKKDYYYSAWSKIKSVKLKK